jgi:hypothetical protein
MEAETVADVAPTRVPPKRRRVKVLSPVDRRTTFGRRVIELRATFAAALAVDGAPLSPVRRLQVETAAQAYAVAELCRGQFIRNGGGDMSDLAAIERRADGGQELPAKVVQERPGHSSIMMTMDVYGHLFPRGDD